MALYHLACGTITRSKGRSLIGAVAYIQGKKYEDERTGLVHDYSKKSVSEFGVATPEHVPEWMRGVDNIEQLLNYYERCEDQIHADKFKGNQKDPVKREKSLAQREKYISSAQMARTFEFALQRELSEQGNKNIINKQANFFTEKGFSVFWAIHNEKGNPHCHMVILGREHEEEKFSKQKEFTKKIDNKTNNMFTSYALKHVHRPNLEKYINEELELENCKERVSCKSNIERKINLTPTIHVGTYASKYLDDDEYSTIGEKNEAIRRENFVKVLNDPGILVRKIAQERSSFTKSDIASEVFKMAQGDDVRYSALLQKVSNYAESLMFDSSMGKVANDNVAMDSKEVLWKLEQGVEDFVSHLLADKDSVVNAGMNVSGEEIYTSKEEMLKQEVTVDLVKKMGGDSSVAGLDSRVVDTAIDSSLSGAVFTNYSVEQERAIRFLTSGGQLQVLNGRAGTGKSTVIKPVYEAYRNAGYKVIGTAFQGRVAEQLERDTGMSGCTISALVKRWNSYDNYYNGNYGGKSLAQARAGMQKLAPWQLDSRSVLVVDEGAMVSFKQMNTLLERAYSVDAKVIVVEDRNQIRTLFGTDISKVIEDNARVVSLEDIYRQQVVWQREASFLANDHKITEGLLRYDNHGLVNRVENLDIATSGVVAKYLDLVSKNPKANNVVLAKQNSVVNGINEQIYNKLRDSGIYGETHSFAVKDISSGVVSNKEFAVGSKVLLRKNDNEWGVKTIEGGAVGVKNGSFGVVDSFNKQDNLIRVRLQDNRLVEFDYTKYNTLSRSYAMTVNISQGNTFDGVVGLVERGMSLGDLVVLLTRHRDSLELSYSTQDFKLLADIEKYASGGSKSLLVDYSVNNSDRPYFEMVANYKEVSKSLRDTYEIIQATKQEYDMRGDEYNLSDHPLWKSFNDHKAEQKNIALNILDNWGKCKTFAEQSYLGERLLEEKAGLSAPLYSQFEREAISQVASYFDVAQSVTVLREQIQANNPIGLIEYHKDHSKYLQLCATRNAIAHSIHSNMALYRDHLKVNYDKGDNGGVVYTTPWGAYHKRPPTMKTLANHAKLFAERHSEENYLHTLSGNELRLYESLMTYRDSMRTSSTAFYKLSNSYGNVPAVTEKLMDIYNDASQRRDLIAYDVLNKYNFPTDGSSLNNSVVAKNATGETSDSIDSTLFESMVDRVGGIAESKLLNHAYRGELRTVCKRYTGSNALEERLKTVEELYRLTLGSDGKMSKSAYGALKDLGADVNRIRFENTYAESVRLAGDQSSIKYSSIEQLHNAYINIATFKELNSECGKQWGIINAGAIGYVSDLQSKYLDGLHTQGIGKDIDYQELQYEIMRLSDKQGDNSNRVRFDKEQNRFVSVNGLSEVNDNVLAIAEEKILKLAGGDDLLKSGVDVISNEMVSARESLNSYAGIVKLYNSVSSKSLSSSLDSYKDSMINRELYGHKLFNEINSDSQLKEVLNGSNILSLVKLEHYANRGEIRALCREYVTQSTLSDRLDIGGKLHNLVNNTDIGKGKYGILKEEHIDIDRLIFEQANKSYTGNGYNNISELEADYGLVARFKELNRQCGELGQLSKEDSSKLSDFGLSIIERDSYSRELLLNINNDDRLRIIVEESKLINLDRLKQYAQRAELRDISNNYLSQEALDDRLESAVGLYTKIADDKGKISKSYYGLVRSVGVDIDRLKFEQLYVEKLSGIDSSLTFKDLSEFNNSYPVIKDYFVDHNTCGRLWHRMVDDGKSIVTEFCKSHLELLQKEGVATDLTYEGLVESAKEYTIEQRAIELKAQQVEYERTGKKSYLTSKDVHEYRFVLTKLQELSSGLDNDQISTKASSIKKFDAGLNKGYMRWVNVHTAHRGEKVYNEWLDNYQKKLPYAYDLINSRGQLLESIYDEKIFARILKEAGIHANKNNLAINHSGRLGNSNLSSVKETPRVNHGRSNFEETLGGDHDYTISGNASVATSNVRDGLQQNNSLNNKTTTRSLSKHELDSLCNDVCRSVDIERLISSISNSFVLNKSMSNNTQVRYGSLGELVINRDSGLWKNFATDEGGTLIKFVQNELGTSFKDSLSYMQTYVTADVSVRIDSFLGNKMDIVIDHDKLEQLREESAKQAEFREQQQQEINQAKILSARDIYSKSVSIEGTQVVEYLRGRRTMEGRQVTDIPNSNIRYLESGTSFNYNGKDTTVYNGAMVVASRDSENNIVGVQLTYLENGNKQVGRDGKVLNKFQYGALSDGLVQLSGAIKTGNTNELNTADSSSKFTIVCEGVETALSIKESIVTEGNKDNIDIYASNGISNLANIADRGYSDVLICGDYDGVGAKSSHKTEQVVQNLREQGINVSVIYPSPDEINPDKKLDFNDVLCSENGKQEIQQTVYTALEKLSPELFSQIDTNIVKVDNYVSIINEELTNESNTQDSSFRGNNTEDLQTDYSVSVRDSVGEAQVAGESERERSLPSENQQSLLISNIRDFITDRVNVSFPESSYFYNYNPDERVISMGYEGTYQEMVNAVSMTHRFYYPEHNDGKIPTEEYMQSKQELFERTSSYMMDYFAKTGNFANRGLFEMIQNRVEYELQRQSEIVNEIIASNPDQSNINEYTYLQANIEAKYLSRIEGRFATENALDNLQKSETIISENPDQAQDGVIVPKCLYSSDYSASAQEVYKESNKLVDNLSSQLQESCDLDKSYSDILAKLCVQNEIIHESGIIDNQIEKYIEQAQGIVDRIEYLSEKNSHKFPETDMNIISDYISYMEQEYKYEYSLYEDDNTDGYDIYSESFDKTSDDIKEFRLENEDRLEKLEEERLMEDEYEDGIEDDERYRGFEL